MKHVALLLLLALTACDDNLAHTPPPMDHFFFPSGLALTPTASGNQALLVASGNFDLRYDQETGATLLSVDPTVHGAQLAKLGPGARLGSFAGPVTVASEANCSGLSGGTQAFVASRYTRRLYRFPLAVPGEVAPCSSEPCQLETDPVLTDPSAIAVACRADPILRRRSLFLGYLGTPQKDGVGAGMGWMSEYDLDDLGKPPRTFYLAGGPVGDMAYDATTDRLYAVGRFDGLTAPLFILNLPACAYVPPVPPATSPDCQKPRVQVVDLYSSLRGAELIGIALSHPQPGRPRLAYISASLYDEAYAQATQFRPPYDLGGALMVVELQEGVSGDVVARLRQVIPMGVGAGPVRVLPVRPGMGDIVVVPSTGDGTLQVYDGEVEAMVRSISIDPATGAPQAGHHPSAMAVEDRGTEALVYVAAFGDWTVGILKVPLANPASADLLRDAAGKPLRIGSPQP